MSRFKCSVLVVDDEPALLNPGGGFSAADYDFLGCESAEEAKEIFNHREVEIVVSDQQLPGMQGIPFLEWVRRNPRAPSAS